MAFLPRLTQDPRTKKTEDLSALPHHAVQRERLSQGGRGQRAGILGSARLVAAELAAGKLQRPDNVAGQHRFCCPAGDGSAERLQRCRESGRRGRLRGGCGHQREWVESQPFELAAHWRVAMGQLRRRADRLASGCPPVEHHRAD